MYKCPTPRCNEYGRADHVYPEPAKPGTFRCDACGGQTTDGETWIHKCARCGVIVKPGELTGLFVPHLCRPCEEAVAKEDVARGHVCGMCRKPYSRCCC